MSEDRAREYAEWYVWAKRNLSSTPEICHAAAKAAADAKRSGGDPQAAARTAAQSRSGPAWSEPEAPEIRQYAEWYDWARIELGASGEDLSRATTAAVGALREGGDAAAAASAARAALGRGEPAAGSPPPPAPSAPAGFPPPPAPPSPGPQPPPPGAQPAPMPPPPGGLPPPPPPPPGYPPSAPPPGYPSSAPPSWSPGSYPAAAPSGLPGPYGYPVSTGTDGYAIASLVCSIVALPAILCYGVPGIILGLVGFFLGRSALKRIKAGGGLKAGHGVATAGWIVGIIAAGLGLLYGVVVIGAIALVASGIIPIPSPSP
jgi:hypothetical protein